MQIHAVVIGLSENHFLTIQKLTKIYLANLLGINRELIQVHHVEGEKVVGSLDVHGTLDTNQKNKLRQATSLGGSLTFVNNVEFIERN